MRSHAWLAPSLVTWGSSSPNSVGVMITGGDNVNSDKRAGEGLTGGHYNGEGVGRWS